MKTHIIHDDFLSFKITKILVEFFQTIAKVAPRWNKLVLYKVGDTSEIRRPDPEGKQIT